MIYDSEEMRPNNEGTKGASYQQVPLHVMQQGGWILLNGLQEMSPEPPSQLNPGHMHIGSLTEQPSTPGTSQGGCGGPCLG